MKHFLLLSLFLALFVSCNFYPDGKAGTGELSFVANDQEISFWQNSFRNQLHDILNLKQNLWEKAFFIRPDKDIDNFKGVLISAQDLVDNYSFFEIKTEQKFDCSKIYIEDSRDLQYFRLYSCDNPIDPIRLYFVSHQTFANSLIGVNADNSAYIVAALLIPDKSMVPLKDGAKKAPTLIYYHGHGTDFIKAGFDKDDYTKGIAYKTALKGFVVLVPNVRSMGPYHILPDYDHIAYTDYIWKNFHRSVLAEASLDASYAESFLENGFIDDLLEYGLDLNANFISGISFGGQIAHLAGALDNRFEVVSSHGSYYGFDVINNSRAHCACQRLYEIEGKANIFDISMLIYPRLLHIGMGGKDKFFNGFSKTAISLLKQGHDKIQSKICVGNANDYDLTSFLGSNLPLFTSQKFCNIIIDIDKNVEHEFISDPNFFFQVYQYLN